MTFVDPASARPLLEKAYQAFVDTDDEIGPLLTATTILEGIYFEFEDLKPMDPWIDCVVALLQNGVRPPTAEDDLRANSAVMMGAIFRAPMHLALESCLRRVFDLLKEPFDANLKVAAASMVHAYANVAMDAQAEYMASAIARPLLGSKELSPPRALFYWKAEGYSHYLRGRYVQALGCFDAADSIARQHSIQDINAISVDLSRGLCERRAGLLDDAEATMRRSESLPIPSRGHQRARLLLLQAVVAFDRGNSQYAIETILKAYQAYDDAGFFNGVVTVGTVASNMAVAAGRFDVANQILGRLRSENYGTIGENYLAAIILNQAWLSHRSGNFESRDRLLGDALRRARIDGARIRFPWYANAMAELLPIALSSGIEADMARALAREFSVAPDPPDAEEWPWAVKVYTLGRFELLIDGESPGYSRKAPKKVLALLKAIVAYGGVEVPEQRLMQALWPDEEGDAARRALTATLHRLRKLLGNAKAILQAGGALTLNEQYCWIDALAFEQRLESPVLEADGLERAIALYLGPFLAQDDDVPWAVPMRERLRAKFIQTIGKHATDMVAVGRQEQAIALYLRGIEADPLV